MKYQERRPYEALNIRNQKKQLIKFLGAKKAFALPLTYLILFVSLMAIVTVTYSFAVTKIGARGAVIRASVAQRNMESLDEAVRSVAWSSGASRVLYMDDCGGNFQLQPAAKSLVINFTDQQSFYDIVFNNSIGQASYQLEPSEFDYDGLFIRGDGRAIINLSSHVMTQLHVTTGESSKELILCYRPSTTSITTSSSDGKPQNLIRIYVLNMNPSQTLWLKGSFHLRVTSLGLTTTIRQYEYNESVSSLALEATLDETKNTVWLPILSNAEGAIVTLETVVCDLKIQQVRV